MTDPQDDLDLLDRVIAQAKAAGAEAADALLVHSVSLSYAQRLGQLERLERDESNDLGLRVLIGRRQAIVSSSDRSPGALNDLVERAVAMARVVPEDPHCGLAAPGQLAKKQPELDICDASEPSPETLIERAAACEEAARAVTGITNSEGAEAGWSLGRVTLAASNGFAGSYASSGHSLGVAVVAGEGLGMERDYDFSSAVHGGDLDDPAEVGRRAGERTVKRLGARKAATGKVPVVLDPRVSNGLLRHLAGAINGIAVARGTSFLKDKLGERIFPERVTIVDDPHRPRGLRSKPFDGEGVANGRLAVVEEGRLATWILDLASARQLGLKTTGRAARGTSSPPSPATTNLYMEAGGVSPAELMADIKSGFYVTEMMGMGVNGVTGDYSRGAAGFWIENGELAYPVSELTVAGNLKDMFLKITPADDLVFRYGANAPTLRIEGMTVAGA
ncbi:MAG: metallopeptidase TldD-related protein [Rhodospirillales bacterium]|nr:metallopeptidase TldD-related protein [Rhodospirillales bacterium]